MRALSSSPAPVARCAPARARAWFAALLVLALGLYAPSLGAGYMADDFGVQLVLDGRIESPTWKPWSLYDFGTLASAPESSTERAAFPWWVDADWKVRFFRPLTSLSLWLDYALFGSSPAAGHAVNLGLFALLLVAARRLYAQLGLAHRTALLALAIFVADNGGLLPVGWIANRNSLLEALFAALALHAGLVARERGSRRHFVAALWLAFFALLAKESGLHVAAGLTLLFFFARRADAPPRLSRVVVVAPLALALVYLAGYAASGMGSNVLFYPMPWSAPAEFARGAMAMFVCAPIAAVSPFPIDALLLAPEYSRALLALAAVFGVGIVALFVPRLRGVRASGLLTLLGVLALLPQAGAPPSDRLMFTPMLYWAPLIALVLERTLTAAWRERTSRGMRLAARSIAVAQVLSALVVLGGGLGMAKSWARMRSVIAGADVGPAELGERHAFVLQASPSSLVALGPLSTWIFEGGSERVRFHPLQAGQRALTWTRSAEDRFMLESLDGAFLSNPIERVFLTAEPRAGGERTWKTRYFEVHGAPDADGELWRLEFRLDTSLDDPRWRFLVFDGQRLVHRAPPRIGESVRFERGERDPFLP